MFILFIAQQLWYVLMSLLFLKKSQILLTKPAKYFFSFLKKYFWPILGKSSIFKEIFLSYLFLFRKWFVYLLQFHNPNSELYLMSNIDQKTMQCGFGVFENFLGINKVRNPWNIWRFVLQLFSSSQICLKSFNFKTF